MRSDYRHNKLIGDMGESMAAKYLIENGYTVIARQERTPYGEIDIIAKKDGVTAFVEVKTRSTDRYGTGAEAIGRSKQRTMLASAQYYISTKMHGNPNVRIDVIEITLSTGVLRHIENAIQ